MEQLRLDQAKGKWLMMATTFASSMAFIDGSALNVVLPSIQKELGASGTDLFWILNSYLVILSAFVLPGGALGDKLGKRRIFLTGVVLFTAGSFLCGFVFSVGSLIAARSLLGFGGALMIPGSLALITSHIDQTQRAQAIASWSAVSMVIGVLGPVLGGFLGDVGLWRYIFFLNVPVGLLVIVLLRVPLKGLQERRPAKGRIDLRGAMTLVVSLVLITYGLLAAPASGLTAPKVYLTVLLGFLSLLFFLRIEKNSGTAMLPSRLFANRTFAGLNLLTLLFYAALNGAMLFISLGFVQLHGYSQLQSGMTFLPFTFFMLLFSGTIGRLSARYGPENFLVGGLFITGCSFFYFSTIGQTTGPGAYWSSFFPGVLVFSVGMTLTIAPLTALVMSSLGVTCAGTASGINNAASRISNILANGFFGGLAVYIFGTTLSSKLTGNADHFTPAQVDAILGQAVNLGDAKVPQSLEATQKITVGSYYAMSFLESYRLCFACRPCFVLWLRCWPIVCSGAHQKERKDRS